jgi:hypothetical protein
MSPWGASNYRDQLRGRYPSRTRQCFSKSTHAAQMSAILFLDRTMACVLRTTAENKATHGKSLWHFVSSPVPLLSQFHGGTTPAALSARGLRSPFVAWSEIGLRRSKRGLWAFLFIIRRKAICAGCFLKQSYRRPVLWIADDGPLGSTVTRCTVLM